MSSSGPRPPHGGVPTPDGTVYGGPVSEAERNRELIDPDLIEARAELRRFVLRVFGWTGFGLLLTAFFGLWIAKHPDWVIVLGSGIWVELLLVAEIVAVGFLSENLERMDAASALATFAAYACLNGVTFAAFFALVPPRAVPLAFACAALMFLGAAAFGSYSDRDLLSLRGLAVTGGIGYAIAAVINLAWGNSMLYWAASLVGVTAFWALLVELASDIRDLHGAFDEDEEGRGKSAIVGALVLYVSFVNVYLHIIRAMRSRQR